MTSDLFSVQEIMWYQCCDFLVKKGYDKNKLVTRH